MTIDQLNTRYGAPGRIVFRPGHAGHPNVVLANKYGTAEIALCGGYVVSYRPTGHSEVLFFNRDRDYNRGEGVHGGIPVCWPQFGNRAIDGMKQHGFARFMVFEVRGSVYSEDMTEITIGLRSSPDTKALWPHDFDLEYRISVSMKLNLKLVTKNTGTAPFAFTAGFHPYFLVRNRADVSVRGVDGLSYVDGRDMSDKVFAGDFAATDSSDHIVTLKPEPKHEFALLDPGLKRAIGIVFFRGERLVIWNPGPEGIGGFADLGAEDWKRFLCVEPVTDWPRPTTELKPGESAEFTAAFQSNLES